MRQRTLHILTWATVVGATASALWLASVDAGWPEWRRLLVADAAPSPAAQAPSASRAPATSAAPT